MNILIRALSARHPIRNLAILAAPACILLTIRTGAGLDDIARAINAAAEGKP